MEREYGSLTRGMLASYAKMRKAMKNRAISAGPSATNTVSKSAEGRAAMNQGDAKSNQARTIFTTLKGGMCQLTDALTAKLNPANIRLSTPVSSLEPIGTPTNQAWLVRTGASESGPAAEQQFDAVIIATQAWAAGRLLNRVDPALSADLTGVIYSSSVTVNLVYNDEAALKLPEGFGFLVPASEGRSMLACTFVHRKFLGRTPEGKAVLRAFLGGMRGEALLAETDANLIATVRRELQEILGITAEPSATRVTRWSRSMAQYSVGHNDRKARISERVAKLKGLYLAGNAYDGIGISDCIRLGKKAVADALGSN
jgi:oxygen-dependent protoporphyrinogen oxidase